MFRIKLNGMNVIERLKAIGKFDTLGNVAVFGIHCFIVATKPSDGREGIYDP